jgi:transposase
MANVLSDEKRQQVLALGRLGWSLRRIEEATGVRRETASAYLKAAGLDVRRPRGRRLAAEPASEVTADSPVAAAPSSAAESTPCAKPASEVTTDSSVVELERRPSRSPAASACEPYRELIEAGLRQGRNAKAIWEDLVDDHGFAAKYESVKRFARKLRGVEVPVAHPVIVTAPGEEAQVDYGTGPMVRHPETGKYRRTRLFSLTLGYSRKSVRLLTFRSSSRTWAELHERAFRRLGAVPLLVVLDNLREGVIEPDFYDPKLNPLYRDVLAHYGVTAMPCRVRHPDRKGKVESGIGHAQNKLKGLRFETLEEAQAYLDRWEERWADTRIHGTTKQQVAAMFAEEKPAMLPLPIEPFRYYEYGMRTVHLDGCVEVRGAYYAPPPGWIGHDVSVQWNELHVRILDPKTGELLREHLRTRQGRFSIRDDDRPKATPKSTVWLLGRARELGEQIGQLCEYIHRHDGEAPGVRRIQGVLGLSKKHGLEALEKACGFALEQGAPSYRFVRRLLEHSINPPVDLRQVDPLIRELKHYRDLIERQTQGDA